MKYSQEILDEMCDKVDLFEYASKTIDFVRRGKTYAAHCPKHIDKTPSLIITPSQNLFYCHSCHVGGNILTWLIKMENMSFNDAVDKLSNMTGTDVHQPKQCEMIRYYSSIKRMIVYKKKRKEIKREILPDSYLDKFATEHPDEWLQEGISGWVLDKYNIRIDKSANRIIYPVYDSNFNLIGVKGRTRYKNYKSMGLQKYQNYQKIGTTDYFAGMKENIDAIKQANEVIIFEGIKSGMKIESWGHNNNWIASETSHMNDSQIELLIKLGIKNVIIAYDSDVTMQSIIDNTRLLRKFINVYIVKDKYGLLGDKESPVDRGDEIWKILLEKKIRI